MYKFTLTIFVFLIAVSGASQDSSPSTNSIFFGYSRRTVEGGQVFPAQEIANGWGLSFDHMFSPHIGLTADFAGQYGRVLAPQGPLDCLAYPYAPNCIEVHDFASHQFLFGPRFTMTGGRMTAFAHPLIGFSILSGGYPQTDFTMGFGGGLDIALTRRIAVRAFQADFIPEKIDASFHDWRYNVRLESGVVFRFGGK